MDISEAVDGEIGGDMEASGKVGERGGVDSGEDGTDILCDNG